MTRERIAGMGAVGLLAALLGWNAVLMARDCESLRPWGAGDRAPDVTLARLDAPGTQALSGLRGQVVLIDFWATWCGPCRQSMPAIERLWQAHQAEGFTVVSINIEGPRLAERARAFARSFRPQLTFPLYTDDGRAGSLYRVDAIPHMVLVDRAGVVQLVHVGALGEGTARELDARVRALLARAP